MSNILDLQPTDETFARPANFDLEAFWLEHLRDFHRRRITGTARLRLSPSLMARLGDVADTVLRAAARAGRLDDTGWTIVELPVAAYPPRPH